jgi:hypothetical protein
MGLAMKFGRPDVDAFLRELSRGQLSEWLGWVFLEEGGKLPRDTQGMTPAEIMAAALSKG